MEFVDLEKLKASPDFVGNIRWDVTPKVFMTPKTASGENVDVEHGYMFYVDLVKDRPTLIIMQLKHPLSKTVAYVTGVPEDLLRECLLCTESECIGGMYPISDKLADWIKKGLGLS